ncbi:MAG: hypothetical protein N2D54_12345, partial [Chloroflexota bacterium]
MESTEQVHPEKSTESNNPKSSGLLYRLVRGSGRGFIYVVLAAWGLVAIVPFLWMLSTSVMTLGESIGGGLVTKHKILEKFDLTDNEMNTLLADRVPEFVSENDNLTASLLKMTALEY